MNVKGTAAGGGNALLIPMTEFSLGLTGDINDIMNAHNLAMTALNARMQHERNYDDAKLAQRGLRRLDIDPERVQWSFVLDFCCQALRKMRIGLGEGKMDGYPMDTCANIAVSSELMAILAVARDLPDLRRRMIGKHAAHGIEVLDRLLAAGIEFHAQIVLMPDENDGEVLRETLGWAYARPGILDVCIVPLGFTKHQTCFLANSLNLVSISVKCDN